MAVDAEVSRRDGLSPTGLADLGWGPIDIRSAALVLLGVVLALGYLASPVRTAAQAASLRQLAAGSLTVSDDLATARIEIAAGSGGYVTYPAGTLPIDATGFTVNLDFDPRDPGPQELQLGVHAGARVGEIDLRFYSAAYYSHIGAPQPGVLLMATSLPRIPSISSSYSTDAPSRTASTSPSARLWAAARARGEVPLVTNDVATSAAQLLLKVNAVGNAAASECSDHLSGFETFESVVTQSCWVWCTGNAIMMRGFLRSAGVPARVTFLQPVMSTLSNGVLVEASEAHATVEWWNGRAWQWIGPTYGVVRAADSRGAPLSVPELVRDLADPAARSGLVFTRVDLATGRLQTLDFASEDAAFREHLLLDFSADKTITIVGAPSSAPFQSEILLLTIVAIASLSLSAAAMLTRRSKVRVNDSLVHGQFAGLVRIWSRVSRR